jgi:hypothetical protein
VTGSRLFLLWVGILAAPLAWLGQLAVGYGVIEDGCSPDGGSGEVFGVGAGSTAVVLSVGAVALALVGVAAAFRTWRTASASGAGFLGFAGVVGGLILLATIVLAGAGVLTLDPCAQS